MTPEAARSSTTTIPSPTTWCRRFSCSAPTCRCTATTRSRWQQALALEPTHLCISPGPGPARGRGRVARHASPAFERRVPLLGVCLGHQSLVHHFGGRIVSAPRLMHGKTSMIDHDGRTIYQGLSNPFQAGRYHSLAAEDESMPAVLRGHGPLRARRDHGRASPRAAAGRRAVPPRERADARGQPPPGKLPEARAGERSRQPAARAPAEPARTSRRPRRQALMRALTDETLPPAVAGAVLAALRAKGETRRGSARLRPRDARRWRAGVRPAGRARRRRHRRHRRRRLGQPQPLHRHGAARRGLRRAGRQARQPLGVLEVRQRRRAGGARRAAGPRSDEALACLRDCGFTFLFAPNFHPAMKAVAPVRRALGVRTVFNILGPLTNPGGAAVRTDRRVRPADRAADGRHAGRPADRALLRRARRARLGRGDAGRALRGVRRAAGLGAPAASRSGPLRHRALPARGPGGRRRGAQCARAGGRADRPRPRARTATRSCSAPALVLDLTGRARGSAQRHRGGAPRARRRRRRAVCCSGPAPAFRGATHER